nr:unnamed protein product [Callosobruchus analis]
MLDERLRFSKHIKYKLQIAYFNLKSIYQSREFLSIKKYNHTSHKLKNANWINMKNCLMFHGACLYYSLLKTKEPQYLFEKAKLKRSFSYIIKFHNLLNDLTFISSKSAFKAKFTQALTSLQSN